MDLEAVVAVADPDDPPTRKVGGNLDGSSPSAPGNGRVLVHNRRHSVDQLGVVAHDTLDGCSSSAESDSTCRSWTVTLTSTTSRPVIRSTELMTLRRIEAARSASDTP